MSSEWVFEYVCQVLQSPTWEVPVMSFIDETCAIFDNEEENKLGHMDAHLDFKNLVEVLLTQHLAEVGISADAFYEACEKAYKRKQNGDFATRIIEQLIACDDFLTFKAIMFKRNKELELEALEALGQEDDSDDDEEEYLAVDGYSESKVGDLERQEQDDLEEALELSAETEKLRELSLLEMEQADIETAIALSLAIEGERLRLLSEQGSESKESKEEKEEKSAGGSRREQIALHREKKEAAEAAIIGSTSMGSASEFDEVDLARRKKHIEAQRKRLLAAKQKEREEQLREYNEAKAQPSVKQPIKENKVPPAQMKKELSMEQGQLTYALARRMKSELLQTTMDESGGSTFSSLDAKLKQVEQLRKERANLIRGGI